MIYVLHLFEVDAAECAAFTSAFDPGCFWLKIVSTILGHQQGKPNIFLGIEFWVSEEHFLRSRDSVRVHSLDHWIRSATVADFNLGIFQFRDPDTNSHCLATCATSEDRLDRENA